MTTMIGVREIARNVNLLAEYDYVDVEDKKTHEYKGLFVSPKYADEFKRYLEEKLSKERQAKLERFKTYAGKGRIDPKYNDLSSSELKKAAAKERHG